MLYRFRFVEPCYFGGDDGEGDARAGMTSRESQESFDAASDDEALLQAIKIMRQCSKEYLGRTLLVTAISLHRIVDISTLHRGAKAA